VLRDLIRDRVVAVLALDPSEPIAPDQPLDALGLDSLIAVELRNALGEAVGATLPATLLFDYPTIEALTGHLADEVLGLEAPEQGAATDRPDEGAPEDLSELDELSDDEAQELLAEELAGIDRLLGDD
jgi:acyl carrier protein